MITESLLLVMLILVIVVYGLIRWNRGLRRELDMLAFSKQSLSTKYGKMTEQFLPFLEEYPYNRQNFRFIGTPIDGVQFEDDRIVFIEFKAGGSTLTTKQKMIKSLVKDGKIEFRELRI